MINLYGTPIRFRYLEVALLLSKMRGNRLRSCPVKSGRALMGHRLRSGVAEMKVLTSRAWSIAWRMGVAIPSCTKTGRTAILAVGSGFSVALPMNNAVLSPVVPMTIGGDGQARGIYIPETVVYGAAVCPHEPADGRIALQGRAAVACRDLASRSIVSSSAMCRKEKSPAPETLSPEPGFGYLSPPPKHSGVCAVISGRTARKRGFTHTNFFAGVQGIDIEFHITMHCLKIFSLVEIRHFRVLPKGTASSQFVPSVLDLSRGICT